MPEACFRRRLGASLRLGYLGGSLPVICMRLGRSSRQPGANLNFVAIDFETANNRRDSACAIGLVKVVDGRIIDTAHYLIRPPTREFIFTYIHGLSWKDVANAPDFGELWPSIAPWFDGAEFLAAHNAPFDKGVLNACCASYSLAQPGLPFRCTVQIARSSWKIYPTKLPDVCRKLNIALDHHQALSDAMACAQIVLSAHKHMAERKLLADPQQC